MLNCPSCGCNDVDARRGAGGWGQPGFECRCNHCGCRFTVADPDGDAEVVSYAVQFAQQVCPRCGSKRTEIASTRRKQGDPTIRYHRCLDCDRPFKSVEAA